jgi:hypothetical protein
MLKKRHKQNPPFDSGSGPVAEFPSFSMTRLPIIQNVFLLFCRRIALHINFYIIHLPQLEALREFNVYSKFHTSLSADRVELGARTVVESEPKKVVSVSRRTRVTRETRGTRCASVMNTLVTRPRNSSSSPFDSGSGHEPSQIQYRFLPDFWKKLCSRNYSGQPTAT